MKFDFPNSSGEILSGRLEMPLGKPKAYALFAHCFTCSKDIVAPNIISKTLAENGIAVLRFDFTGLGNSQGDFANTNFSSNVEDLLSACKSLGEEFAPPEILIGHSLGGAAVLKAAKKIETVKALVTIGSPSNIEHVKHQFGNEVSQIEKEGKAKVILAGREFTIKKQFIDDLTKVSILEDLKEIKKALLVMHSPIDDTVSIEHASKIFTSAKHPKSFVTLDKADHLLMKKQDAKYAGEVIGSWALRYISTDTPELEKIKKVATGTVLVKSRTDKAFTHDIYTADHHSIADEPLSLKGDNLGMAPYDYLLSSLGACTSMTMKMYAKHKGLNLTNVTVNLNHKKVDAKEFENYETESGKVDVIEKSIKIEGELTDKERARLYEIAEKCPVNKTLLGKIKIISKY